MSRCHHEHCVVLAVKLCTVQDFEFFTYIWIQKVSYCDSYQSHQHSDTKIPNVRGLIFEGSLVRSFSTVKLKWNKVGEKNFMQYWQRGPYTLVIMLFPLNTVRWLDLGQLPDAHTAALSLPRQGRGENKMEKLMDQQGVYLPLAGYQHGQNRLDLRNIYLIYGQAK